MAELGPDAPALHREIGARARAASTSWSASASWPALYLDGAGERVVRRRRRRGRRAPGPAAARRRGAAEGIAQRRARAPRWRPPRDAGARARCCSRAVLSIIVGGRFIRFLHARSLGQHIREEGPAGHKTKQGTPTMGGVLIIAITAVSFLPSRDRSDQALCVLAVTLLCAGDRLRRRLLEDRQAPLARARGPLEDGAADPRRRAARRSSRTTRASRPTCTCRSSTSTSTSASAGTCSSTWWSRARPTASTSRTASTASPRAPRSSRCSVTRRSA